MHTILYFLFNSTLPCIWWKFSEIVMYKREYTNCPNFVYFIFPKCSRQGYLEVIAGPFHFGDFQLCQILVFLFSSKMMLLVWIQYDWFLTHWVRYWKSYRVFFFFFKCAFPQIHFQKKTGKRCLSPLCLLRFYPDAKLWNSQSRWAGQCKHSPVLAFLWCQHLCQDNPYSSHAQYFLKQSYSI